MKRKALRLNPYPESANFLLLTHGWTDRQIYNYNTLFMFVNNDMQETKEGERWKTKSLLSQPKAVPRSHTDKQNHPLNPHPTAHRLSHWDTTNEILEIMGSDLAHAPHQSLPPSTGIALPGLGLRTAGPDCHRVGLACHVISQEKPQWVGECFSRWPLGPLRPLHLSSGLDKGEAHC